MKNKVSLTDEERKGMDERKKQRERRLEKKKEKIRRGIKNDTSLTSGNHNNKDNDQRQIYYVFLTSMYNAEKKSVLKFT